MDSPFVNEAFLDQPSPPSSGVVDQRRKNNNYLKENSFSNSHNEDERTSLKNNSIQTSFKSRLQPKSISRRRMAFYFSNSLIFMQIVLLSSFHINSSSSSEITSFQQQYGGSGSSSVNNNLNSNNNNNNIISNNGIYSNNGGGGGSIISPSTTPSYPFQSSPSYAIPSSASPSIMSPIQSPQTILAHFFIAGLANQIRKINSTAIMLLTQDEPFQLQFKTACPFGNIVYDDKLSISINSGGNMTYSTKDKPLDFPEKVYHSVSDGQWHAITFQGTHISLDDHDLHPHTIPEDGGSSPLINWDTNSSGELHNQQRLHHFLNFFDGFVGCIRVPKIEDRDPKNRDRTSGNLQSHEEAYSQPESPSEHRIRSLIEIFGLGGASYFPPCNDSVVDLITLHPCFEPDNFVLCDKCQNGAKCEPEPESQMNNKCVCPPNTDEIEYSGKYCEFPPNQMHSEEFQHQGFSEHEDFEEYGPVSSPSNVEVSNSSDIYVQRMSILNAPSAENAVSTTTTSARPEVDPIQPFTWNSDTQCPCQHNGNCTELNLGQYFCNCSSNFKDIYCQTDVDECAVPNLCNKGVCINSIGSYQCYCQPGFAGKHCSRNFDDCALKPCKNGGTCIDGIDEYSCECVKGYEGMDCDLEIDECEPTPCENGATCYDGLGDYNCTCAPGFEGKNCTIDINECLIPSNPCLNEGQCIDKVNGFECNCFDTGFYGEICELNVNDCREDLCENDGTCVDLIKSYKCNCHPGYNGSNCENDYNECDPSPCINGGECYEKSNQSLYETSSSEPIRQLIDPEFNYAAADGYVCLCKRGFEGENCEINIDDCARAGGNPCGKNGECKDGIDSYECVCHKGYEGARCEIDIDECLTKPCVRGECFDRVADFFCSCPESYGAKNCAVPLTGCIKSPCSVNADKCIAMYDEVTKEHSFQCICPEGYAGLRCELQTTMSYNGSGPVEIVHPSETNYELLFRFRTTLPNVILAVGSGTTYFSLTVTGGKLNLQSSLLNNLNGISSGSNLSNAEWHKVWISINTSHVALAAGSEQTIHPVAETEGQDNSTLFNTTILGGVQHSLTFLNKQKLPHFSGCMQDIYINGDRIILGENLINTTTVEPGCPRNDQCNPNPCENLGRCTDLWQNFTCECERPFLGDRCQFEYTAATFHHESMSNSLVSVEIYPNISNIFANAFDISMFVRTRTKTGTIFILGNENNGNFSVFLEALIGEVGNLIIEAKWSDVPDDPNSKPETYAVDGLQITDGSPHRISIQRDKSLVVISVNGTEHFRKSVNNKIKFNPTVLYIGGKPTFPKSKSLLRIESAASEPVGVVATINGDIVHDNLTAEDSTLHPDDVPSTDLIIPIQAEENHVEPIIEDRMIIITRPFKGVIQDVRVTGNSINPIRIQSQSQNYYVVEFFPLEQNATYSMGKVLGNVTIQSILEGTVSDDTCKFNPCLNDGKCEITWNDFQCNCNQLFDGKRCEVRLHCGIVKCPTGSICQNIGWTGFECVAEAAFDGKGTVSPHYSMNSSERENITINEASFRFRTKQPGNVLYIANDSESFRIGLESEFDSHLNQTLESVAIYINGERHNATQKSTRIMDGQWHQLSTKFTVTENGPVVKVYIDEKEAKDTPETKDKPEEKGLVLTISSIQSDFLNNLVLSLSTDIIVGSHVEHNDRYHIDHHNDEESSLMSHVGHPEDAHKRFYRGCLADVKLGQYRLPFVTPRQLEEENPHNLTLVRSTSPTAFYIEESVSGSSANPHLGCILCYDDECQNGGECENSAEKYECSCSSGFEGPTCAEDIDECVNNECSNGSTCKDGIAQYTCICLPGYTGPRCNINIDECASDYGVSPCKNGGRCIDGIAKFTCECTDDFTGTYCDKRKKSKCSDEPCENGAICYDRSPHYASPVTFECVCQPGYEGETCSDKIDYCKNVTCANGGTCENKQLGSQCLCRAGYDGPRCEKDIDECASNPCLHHGECRDEINGYSCDCERTGFKGPTCSEDINECELPEACSCSHMQRCENTIGSCKCICPDWTKCGIYCDIEDPCYEDGNKTCHNGGTCFSTCHEEETKDWNCICTENFQGQFCDLLTAARPDQPLDILLIIIPVLAALLIAATIAIVILVRMARRKRATRGVYSPSQQEYCNPRVELDNVMKPPPEERLI